jgi:hypothetical protein
MTRLFSLAILASVASFGLGVSGAIADPAPAGCTKEQGLIVCPDPVGNSQNSDGKSQTRDTQSRGNTTNKLCTSGPGNQTSCPE